MAIKVHGSWRLAGEALKKRASNPVPMRLAPEIISLGLVIAIAYALARLTWLVAPLPDSPVAVPAAIGTALASKSGTNKLDLANRVAAMHLFGRANAPASTDAAVNAPKTNLNVTLHGIIAADDPDRSRAIIAAGSGHGGDDAKTYRVGANIPGGASIHDIKADRVILSRNGHLETLTLPRKSNGSGSVRVLPTVARQPQARRPIRTTARPESRQPPQRRTHENRHTMAALGHLVRAQRAVVNGKLIGYRLYPGSNPAAFLGAGLEPGDIVTAVDGKSLSNPANLMVLMKKTKGGGPVRLTVKRDGRTRQVEVSMPN